MDKKSLKGIGLFGMCIAHLISAGYTENTVEIEKHFESLDVVDYIADKYKSEMLVEFDNSIYDKEALNMYYHDYVGYIEGNESRKYGLVDNENDGLVLLLSLLMDRVEKESNKWTI